MTVSKKKTAAKKFKKTKEKKPDRQELLEQIRIYIDAEIQPFIRMDGGEMQILSLEEDGTLKVSLHGACHGCPSSVMTLQFGVQRAINEKFPEYEIVVEAVGEDGEELGSQN